MRPPHRLRGLSWPSSVDRSGADCERSPMQDSGDKSNAGKQPAPEKRPYATPRLRVVGDLRDLVLGQGKSGGTMDSDPVMTPKSGMG